jgi:hypothetical protein
LRSSFYAPLPNLTQTGRRRHLHRENSKQRDVLPENVDTLSAQRQKLRHGLERLIDSLAEGASSRLA